MSRIAILDLGTNTFNLLIADKNGSDINVIAKEREIVKLGEGGLANNTIALIPYQRAINGIKNHMKRISDLKCDHIKAVATSGIRSTNNGLELLKELKTAFNLDVEVIDGDREAELIWKGVIHNIPCPDDVLIMDIGGGSTEFIIGNSDSFKWKKSYKLGASRLKETFQPSDPITEEEMDTINAHFDSELDELYAKCKEYEISSLIGSSGSFDTFAEVIFHKYQKFDEFESADYHDIDLNEFDSQYQFLLKSNLQERLDTPGMLPMRADMIVISGLLTNHVVSHANIQSMHVSKHALKEGLMFEISSVGDE